MVPQKIESRRRKNNSRQQKIIDYLLKGMLEKLSNDKNDICGGKYGGGHTLPLGNSTSFNSYDIKAVSSINMNLSIPTGTCIHIWSSYLILSS